MESRKYRIAALLVLALALGGCVSEVPANPFQPAPDAGVDAGQLDAGGLEDLDAGFDAGFDAGIDFEDAGPALVTIDGHAFTVRHGADGGVLSREGLVWTPRAYTFDGGTAVPLPVEIDGGFFSFVVPEGTLYAVSTDDAYVESRARHLDLDRHLLGSEPTVWLPHVTASVDFQGGAPSPLNSMPVFVPSAGEYGHLWGLFDGGMLYDPDDGWGHSFDGADGHVAYVSRLEPRSTPFRYLTRTSGGASSDTRLSDGGFEMTIELRTGQTLPVNGYMDLSSFGALATRVHPGATPGYGAILDGFAVVSDGSRWIEPPKSLEFLQVNGFPGNYNGLSYTDGLPAEWPRLLDARLYYFYPVKAPHTDTRHSATAGVVVKVGGAWAGHPRVEPPGPIEVTVLEPGEAPSIRVTWTRPTNAQTFEIVVRHIEGGDGTGWRVSRHLTDRTEFEFAHTYLFDPGAWYELQVTARTYGRDAETDTFAPLSTPLEYGYATSASNPVLIPGP